MLRTVQSLPLCRAFDTGLRPDPFPDRAASLLPSLLAVTRTGLPPASDDELTTTDQPPTRSTSCLLGAREWLTDCLGPGPRPPGRSRPVPDRAPGQSGDGSADRRLGHCEGFRQLRLHSITAQIGQGHDDRLEQSQDWRPRMLRCIQAFGMDQAAHLDDVIPGEPCCMIHAGGPLLTIESGNPIMSKSGPPSFERAGVIPLN